MAHIAQADYETITTPCDRCGEILLLNRVSDIGEIGPYSGRDIVCSACGERTWITGDVAGSPFEMFIHDADLHFKNKRYMLAVAVLGQAWELLLSSFADSTFVFRPFFALAPLERDVNELNATWKLLQKHLARFSFFELLNLLFHVKTKSIAPDTLAQSRMLIPSLSNYSRDVRKASIEQLPDSSLREYLLALRSVTIGRLRNNVVHHGAYRPNRTETAKCLEDEVVLMFHLERELGIGTFDEFAAGVVGWPAN